MFDFMLGNVRHQLDEKDRMRIPAKYREALGGTSYILPGRKVDGNHCCLYVIPYDKFEKVFAKLDSDELYGGDERVDAATTILGAAEKLTEDAQGRVKLSKDLARKHGRSVEGLSNRGDLPRFSDKTVPAVYIEGFTAESV